MSSEAGEEKWEDYKQKAVNRSGCIRGLRNVEGKVREYLAVG